MTIIILVAVGVAVVLILGFFAVNRWSGSARDREANAKLRAGRQMPGRGTESRGTGIN